MKYREKLLELIFDDDDDSMIHWILSQPIINQPDIFRELKLISEEAAAANGDDINEAIPTFHTFDSAIDKYENEILDEKLAEAQYVIALDEQEKAFAEMDEALIGIRRYLMDCIINNEPNAEATLEAVKKMIASEKENEIFNPDNWKDILHLL